MKALYRAVAALAALLTVPTLYYLKIVHVVIEFGFMDGFLDDSFSVKQLVDIFSDDGKGFRLPELAPETVRLLAPLKSPFIVTCVFACLTAAMILAVFICSALTNAKRVNCCLAAGGAAATLGTIISFNAMTSKVVDGTVSLSALINANLSGSASTLGKLAGLFGVGDALDSFGELVLLRLHSAVICVMIIFIFILLWSLAFVLVEE